MFQNKLDSPKALNLCGSVQLVMERAVRTTVLQLNPL